MKQKIDEAYIRSIVEKVLAEKQLPPPVIVDGFELTPEPARGKRREYVRTTLTIDQKLWDLVQDECKRFNILPPRFLDSLLWHYFKRPVLSYQKKDEDEKPD